MAASGAVDPPSGDAAPLGPFPDDFPDGFPRAAEAWDLSHLLPMPSKPHQCPFCAGALVVKDWKFHKRFRTGSASPWRCDVRLKCMGCGFVPTFGVLVSKVMFERAAEVFADRGGSWIHWRAGRDAMTRTAAGG